MNIPKIIKEEVSRVISEIGDTTKGYPFKKTRETITQDYVTVFYKFETPEHEYRIEIESDDYMQGTIVSFSAQDIADPTSGLTGEGNPYKVVATVMNAVRQFADEMERGGYPRYYWNKFFFQSAEKRGRNSGSDQRKRLYNKFIRHQFPNAEIRKDGGWISVTR